MRRNSSLQALVLSVRQYGEDNRIVKFLSKEKGIFDAVLYGGPKSKLRAYVSPYHFGNLWIYTDETKHSIKITDFEVIKYHPEIRENLFKTWCASFCAELLIKTDATGEYEKIWTLANGFLDGISVSSEDECRIAFLRFVWRYIGIMGLQCDIESCIHCGETLNPKIHEQKFYYSIVENGFICNNCFSHQNNNDGFELSSEAIIFLQAVTLLSPKEARSIPLHYSTTQQLHEFLTFLINRYTGCKLKTLEMSSGIL